ncbi:MAG TPA: c-type cytochrome domain-containing protein [Planctomycetaceae bacterium]|jgi:mono/diheme cytochrome c family protein
MKSHAVWVSLLVVAYLGLCLSGHSNAAVTSDHKKQIDEAKKEVGKVKALINKKEFDEAAKLLTDAEQKLKAVAKDAQIEESSKLLAGVFKQIKDNQDYLARKRPAPSGAGDAAAAAGAFEKDVAPILTARCLNCHGANDPKAGLQIDTFEGIVRGGDSGPLLTPGKPATSLLVQRITAQGNARMPKGPRPLSGDEIKKITDWVAGGAKFAGNNKTPIAELKAGTATPGVAQPVAGPIRIEKPVGTETVSFTNDIAPFMVNLCLNCHSGADPRSGFSLETFEKLMRGGKSGRVVLPGNTKDSRLWHLVGEQDPIKMPPAQALITRTNHANLKTWIEEGAKFDGRDAKAPLRSLVPTDAEKRARELAKLSPEEFAKRRQERANQLWTAALPNDPPVENTTDLFLVVGNASESRVKQVADWAGSSADRFRKLFKIKEQLIWPGKLTVFVFKDRFSYAEFAQTNENVQIPPDTKGHSRVTSAGDEAYVCLLDIGDSPTEDSPGVRTLLMGLLAEALLQKLPNRVPDWAAKGMGLVLAAQGDPKNPYFRGLSAGAHDALRAADKPEELFANGTFSPSDLAPVGYTMVSFMLKQGGGEAYFVDFLNQTASGKSLNDALKAVYNVDTANLARAYQSYVDGLPGGKAAAKKKK